MREREPAVDPHLLAALRHAPDRDAEPPPQVTARVLAAARDAVRPPAPSTPSWQRFAAWFARPQVGAAFATLAVATLVGVMWSTHEPPVLVPAPTEAAAPSPTAHAPPPAPVTATPAAPAPAPAALERRKAQAERRQDVPREAAAPSVADAPTPAAPAQEPAKVAADAAAAPTAPAPAEAPTKADAEAPALPSGAAAAVPPPAAAAAEARARSERAAKNELGALASGRASAPAAALSLAQRARLFDPLQALDSAGMDGSVWTLAGAAGERAHGDPQRALWTALGQATAGRWQPHSSAPSSAPWLVLRQGGQRTTLRLADGALTITDDQGRTWRAPVSAEQARDWQQSVGSW